MPEKTFEILCLQSKNTYLFGAEEKRHSSDYPLPPNRYHMTFILRWLGVQPQANTQQAVPNQGAAQASPRKWSAKRITAVATLITALAGTGLWAKGAAVLHYLNSFRHPTEQELAAIVNRSTSKVLDEHRKFDEAQNAKTMAFFERMTTAFKLKDGEVVSANRRTVVALGNAATERRGRQRAETGLTAEKQKTADLGADLDAEKRKTAALGKDTAALGQQVRQWLANYNSLVKSNSEKDALYQKGMKAWSLGLEYQNQASALPRRKRAGLLRDALNQYRIANDSHVMPAGMLTALQEQLRSLA